MINRVLKRQNRFLIKNRGFIGAGTISDSFKKETAMVEGGP
jgi:hypothetical protein